MVCHRRVSDSYSGARVEGKVRRRRNGRILRITSQAYVVWVLFSQLVTLSRGG